ncbi:hypothetical protein ACMGD3_22855 [Lysinibacillus sphaericus]|uniref:hypothetical protein n=1 Tax=Lysinibacillus sphaericus TaxID=1421 RepID=UPI001C5D80B8
MEQLILNISDILSTLLVLLLFMAIFFLMINKIKQLKLSAPMPPQEPLERQVDDLTLRVNSLELQGKEMSKSHHANQVVKTKKSP